MDLTVDVTSINSTPTKNTSILPNLEKYPQDTCSHHILNNSKNYHNEPNEQSIPPSPFFLVTAALLHDHVPTLWLKLCLHNIHITLNLKIGNQLIVTIIQDPAFLANMIKKKINHALSNLGNQAWLQAMLLSQTQGHMNQMDTLNYNIFIHPLSIEASVYSMGTSGPSNSNPSNKFGRRPKRIKSNPTRLTHTV